MNAFSISPSSPTTTTSQFQAETENGVADKATEQLSKISRFEVNKVHESDEYDDERSLLRNPIWPTDQTMGAPLATIDEDEDTTTTATSVRYYRNVNRNMAEDSNGDDSEKTQRDKENCFQLNYDRKHRIQSITLSIKDTGLKNTYSNCFKNLLTYTLYRKLFSEFLGTALLVLVICSIGLPIDELHVPSINGCFGAGLTVGSIVWSFGSTSGAHINPAVTLAFLITGKINPILCLLYITSQLLGGYVGALALSYLSTTSKGMLSATIVHQDISAVQAFGIEAIITFNLLFVVFTCIDEKRKDLGGSFPLQIGLSVTVGALMGGQFTGASMNPARSFGPAAVLGFWSNHWVYWAGPICGSTLAGILYECFITLKCQRKLIVEEKQKINLQQV